MESAIFISKVGNLRLADSKYSRLYFGNEFCQRLTPTLRDVKLVMDFALKHQMGFTFVTPYVTNEGMEDLMPILEYIKGRSFKAEFVINDWGVLRLLGKELGYSNLVLGRLLTKQKRGPRILNLKEKIPKDTYQHFKESNIDVPILSEFLINSKINRVELDNLLQGIARESPQLKASLYFPFVYVTTTRFCLTASCEKRREFLRSISACNKECQKYTFRLQHRTMPVDLFLKGNTQFFKNEILPENLEELNIDRLVYEPEIPF